MAQSYTGEITITEQDQEDELNKTPTFFENMEIAQVTPSDRSPQFFNFQEKKPKVLENSRSPFYADGNGRNFRYSNNQIKRMKRANLMQVAEPTDYSESTNNKEFQHIYWR